MRFIIILLIGLIMPCLISAQDSGADYAEVFGAVRSQFDSAENAEPADYETLLPLTQKLSQLIAGLKADTSLQTDPRYEILAQAEKLLAAMNAKRVTGKPGWEFVVNGGFSLTGGNSELLNLTGGLKLGKSLLWVNDISLNINFDYRLDQDEVTYRKWTAFLRYGHSITRELYLFAQGNYRSDFASAVDNGMKFYGGAGYWFFDIPSPKLQLGIEAGGGWYKDYYTGGATESHFILNGRLWFFWNFAEGVAFRQDIDFNPNADDFTKFSFVLKSMTGLDFKINAHLSLALDLSIRYTTDPQPGIKNTDYSHTTKLVFRL
ncbi:MAG: DUF481 domain-containing protein [Brevinematales bacterium]|nr:DUF481 domain-containing protein [Brevinematales bacterium]